MKHNQLEDMLNALPQYSYIGVGRDDGKTKGEYAPIFYRKDKFKLLKSGNFWLSEDTSKPNKGWDAAGNAAGDTAGNAAGDAAGNAAGNAAGDTAGNAAGDTAGNAAGRT